MTVSEKDEKRKILLNYLRKLNMRNEGDWEIG